MLAPPPGRLLVGRAAAQGHRRGHHGVPGSHAGHSAHTHTDGVDLMLMLMLLLMMMLMLLLMMLLMLLLMMKLKPTCAPSTLSRQGRPGAAGSPGAAAGGRSRSLAVVRGSIRGSRWRG